MADILPQDKIKEAKAWLHDIFIWGGLANTPKRTVSVEKYRYMYGTHPENFRQDDKKYRDAAVTICGCIKSRQVETQKFVAFDKAIKLISQCYFLPGLDVGKGCVKEDAETLCKFIAWFCDSNNLVYNNKNTSIEEMKQIKNTLIGATLWDCHLYALGSTPETRPQKPQTTIGDAKTVADPADTASPDIKKTTTTTNGTATATTVNTGGPAGHTLYRKNASGILTTGKLTNISGSGGYVYWIGGEFAKAGKTEPKLHVKPQYGATPLKVNYGSGQGYNDCILYFASEQGARNFLGIADAAKPNTVKSLKIKKIGEDKNGYVEVATEFGNAYIKASKLHEEVEEELEEITIEDKVSNKDVWEAYKDGFFKD